MARKKAPANRRRISRVEGIRGAGSVPLVLATKRHSLLSASTPDSKISAMNVGELEKGIAIEEAVGLGRNDGQLTDIVMSIVLALAVRSIFMVHSLSVIWRTMEYRNDNSVWIFALVSLSMAVEGAMCVMSNAGREKKWFSPCIMLYILATVPPIWLLETSGLHQERGIERNGDVLFLDQILLVLLIVGRWLLPSGRVSKEQLSQILLANVAIATDIGDFFGLLTQRTVYSSRLIQHLVLSAWTLSVLQFPLVLTSSGARKARVALIHGRSAKEPATFGDVSRMLSDIDVLAVLIAHLLQDIPFLAVRLYLFVSKRMVSKAMIFWIAKNILIVLLQTYRLYAIYCERYSGVSRVTSRDAKSKSSDGKKRPSHATSEAIKKQQKRWREISGRAAHKSKSNESTVLREEREIPIKREGETNGQHPSKNQRRKMSAIDDVVVREVVPGHYHLVSGVDLTPPGKEKLLPDL